MKTVLIISSFVAASQVGANAAAFCLRRLGIEAIVLPTTLMGRHPGWGEPGGGSVEADVLRKMWSAIRQQDIKFDAVLSGYLGQDSHIDLCADIIQEIKRNNKSAFTLIDPVMGDNGALYIPATRAEAIAKTLIPLADMITPNVWELSYLVGQNFSSHKEIIEAARSLAPESLITSAPESHDNHDEIGAIWTNHDNVVQVSHKRFSTVPHGGGDALAATVLGHKLSGLSSITATERAVGSIFAIMKAANAMTSNQSGRRELPLIETQDALINAPHLSSRVINI